MKLSDVNTFSASSPCPRDKSAGNEPESVAALVYTPTSIVQLWSLSPGRYVGVAKGEDLCDEDFKEKLETLNEELEVLNAEARELEERIAENVVELLES